MSFILNQQPSHIQEAGKEKIIVKQRHIKKNLPLYLSSVLRINSSQLFTRYTMTLTIDAWQDNDEPISFDISLGDSKYR